MRKEPELPTEVLLVAFIGAVVSILLLLGILKLMDIRRRRKQSNLHPSKGQSERGRTNAKTARRQRKL